jgi:GNAT superfamily N-acetyltransferase
MPVDSNVVIREVQPGEVETIARIAAAAWAPIYETARRMTGEALFAATHPAGLEGKADQVRRACRERGSGRVRLAEKDGCIVGFITYWPDEKTGIGEIGNNAVAPAYQGQGVGGVMYEYAFAELRKLGMRFVRVRTGLDPGHAAARRAYEKAGFDRQVRSVAYYRCL